MYRSLLVVSLFVLPCILGCGGGPIAPAAVNEEERQQMAEQEKSVEAEERAHQAKRQ